MLIQNAIVLVSSRYGSRVPREEPKRHFHSTLFQHTNTSRIRLFRRSSDQFSCWVRIRHYLPTRVASSFRGRRPSRVLGRRHGPAAPCPGRLPSASTGPFRRSGLLSGWRSDKNKALLRSIMRGVSKTHTETFSDAIIQLKTRRSR